MRRTILLGFVAAAALAAYPAKAQTIDAPNAIVAGQPIANWTDGWWGWILPFPVGATPLDDTTGALANANNNGPVFYVAGNSGGTATRSFTVNAGTPLLIPMLNQVFIQYPVALENQLAAAFYGGTVSLNASIDGVPVSNLTSYAETGPIVDYGDAVPGSFGAAYGPTSGFTGDPACPSFDVNDLCPAMSVGYWLMLNLSPGEHTISTGGSEDYMYPDVPSLGLGGEISWSTETTETIDVIPEPASAALLVMGVLAGGLCRRRRVLHCFLPLLRRSMPLLGFLAVAGLAAPPANAQTIDPPNSIVAGQSIADWTVGWWTWLLQFPTVGNPLDDQTGALATANNNGPVFYVAGTAAGPVTRSFSVNAGTPLLFAMANVIPVQWPVSLENQVVADFYAATPDLVATIDGLPVPDLTSYAETSGVASLGDAVPGSLGEAFETPGFPGDPACQNFTPDLLCPAISAGYYLMVNLPPGEHIITTGGTVTFNLPDDPTYIPGGGTVTLDTLTTDIIDVIPEPASGLLLLSALIGTRYCRRRAPHK